MEYDEPEVTEEAADVGDDETTGSSGSSAPTSDAEVHDEQDGPGETSEDESEDGDGDESDEAV